MMITLMISSEFFLHGRGTILLMPFVLLTYAIATIFLRTKQDVLLNIMVAYGMSHFHFATKAGMLGPWIVLAYFLLSFNVLGKFRNVFRTQAHYFLIIVFLLFNLLGLLFNNPNTSFENLTSFVSLIGLALTFYLLTRLYYNAEDIQFIIYVFGIMITYTFLSSMNNGLGLFRTSSPLVTLSEQYFADKFVVPMFGRSFGEYFLCMNLFFAAMIVTPAIRGAKKNYYTAFYLMSFLGCLVGFSKAQTLILVIGNIIIFAFSSVGISAKKLISVTLIIGALAFVLIIGQSYFNLTFIFERFAEQPDLFKNVFENPFTAEGTSRDESFYWGLRRNIDNNSVVGYGWSPADANNAAYFHGMNINIRKHDFHSLYLSVFPVFGWVAGSIFFFWLATFLTRAYKICFSFVKGNHSLIGKSFLGLAVAFLLAEYAIPVTSEANYFFILIVWMGIVNGIYYTARQNVLTSHISSEIIDSPLRRNIK